jgi:hypothetical protein
MSTVSPIPLGPLDENVVVPGKSFHPVLIVIGTLAEHFFAHDWNSDDLAKEMNHLLRSRRSAQVTVDDDTVEAAPQREQRAEIAELRGRYDLLTHREHKWTPAKLRSKFAATSCAKCDPDR